MEAKVKTNKIVPLDELTRGTIKILRREVRPIYYAELTDMVARELNYTNINRIKVKEDVREQVLLKKKQFVYAGKPYSVGFLREWVDLTQAQFNFDSNIKIELTLKSAVSGSVETVRRYEYMLNKNEGGTKKIEHATDASLSFRLNRFIIEKSVADYYKENYSEFYLPPSNEKKYRQPASDDFRMRINGKTYLFDICTPNKDGTIGNVRQKKHADIHIIAQDKGGYIYMTGFVTGKAFGKTWPIGYEYSINKLLFWLNCQKQNISYNQIVKHTYQSNSTHKMKSRQ